jgi:transposase
VGNSAHYVAVRPDRDSEPVRRFECFTADLHRMADWLQSCGVRAVAMQSTGVYWIPLYEILEECGFEVHLVNVRPTKNLPGRKSDVQGRKSHSSCRICQRFDSVAKLSECVDHSRSAGSPRLFGYRRAAFFIANASMQKDPDQLTEAMGNRPDGFIVS